MTARQTARLTAIPVPSGFQFQPVDAREVAVRLVELALGTPVGLVPDIAGPRVYNMAALLRGYLRACRKHRPRSRPSGPQVRPPARFGLARPPPDRAVGRRTWEEFLTERVG